MAIAVNNTKTTVLLNQTLHKLFKVLNEKGIFQYSSYLENHEIKKRSKLEGGVPTLRHVTKKLILHYKHTTVALITTLCTTQTG